MENKNRKPRKRCYNCDHAGEMFRIDVISRLNHLHCEHPKNSPETSPWDTLRKWWDSCSDWEEKINVEPKNTK